MLHKNLDPYDAVLLCQDSLKEVLEERTQQHPQMPAEKVIHDTCFLFRTVANTVRAAKFEGANEISHSMSLIWKYLIVLTDQCMHQQAQRFTQLDQRFESKVSEAVAEKTKRFDHERLTME